MLVKFKASLLLLLNTKDNLLWQRVGLSFLLYKTLIFTSTNQTSELKIKLNIDDDQARCLKAQHHTYVHTMLYFHAMKNKESQFLLQGD